VERTLKDACGPSAAFAHVLGKAKTLARLKTGAVNLANKPHARRAEFFALPIGGFGYAHSPFRRFAGSPIRNSRPTR
jgi:hypothetical protein